MKSCPRSLSWLPVLWCLMLSSQLSIISSWENLNGEDVWHPLIRKCIEEIANWIPRRKAMAWTPFTGMEFLTNSSQFILRGNISQIWNKRTDKVSSKCKSFFSTFDTILSKEIVQAVSIDCWLQSAILVTLSWQRSPCSWCHMKTSYHFLVCHFVISRRL